MSVYVSIAADNDLGVLRNGVAYVFDLFVSCEFLRIASRSGELFHVLHALMFMSSPTLPLMHERCIADCSLVWRSVSAICVSRILCNIVWMFHTSNPVSLIVYSMQLPSWPAVVGHIHSSRIAQRMLYFHFRAGNRCTANRLRYWRSVA